MKRVLMMAVALLPLMLMAQAKIGIVNSQQIFDLISFKNCLVAHMLSSVSEDSIKNEP